MCRRMKRTKTPTMTRTTINRLNITNNTQNNEEVNNSHRYVYTLKRKKREEMITVVTCCRPIRICLGDTIQTVASEVSSK